MGESPHVLLTALLVAVSIPSARSVVLEAVSGLGFRREAKGFHGPFIPDPLYLHRHPEHLVKVVDEDCVGCRTACANSTQCAAFTCVFEEKKACFLLCHNDLFKDIPDECGQDRHTSKADSKTRNSDEGTAVAAAAFGRPDASALQKSLNKGARVLFTRFSDEFGSLNQTGSATPYIVLSAYPKTATSSLINGMIRKAVPVWRFHSPREPQADITQAKVPIRNHWQLPFARLIDSFDCRTEGRCIVISTFRNPVRRAISQQYYITFRYVSVPNQAEQHLLDMDNDSIKEWVYQQMPMYMSVFDSLDHYHRTFSELQQAGYKGTSLLSAPYDSRQGYQTTTLRNQHGGVLEWLALDFEHVDRWQDILNDRIPGFVLPHSLDHRERVDREAKAKAQDVFDRLPRGEWPMSLVSMMKSSDTVQHFYHQNPFPVTGRQGEK